MSQEKSGKTKVQSLFSMSPKDENEVSHIRQVCIENYPKNPAKFSRCVMDLSSLEFVNAVVDSLCAKHQFEGCQKLENVCHKARQICETSKGYQSPLCKQNFNNCLRRIETIQKAHKAQQVHQGTVVSMNAHADLKGSNKALSTSMTMSYKKESSSPKANSYQLISDMEVKTSSTPVYEIKFESRANVPKVNTRWNLQQLLQEAFELALNGQVSYGYENKQKATIKMTNQMAKSSEQKESVRQSPEYQRCTQVEQEGKKLSNVCEFARHQAASIDELQTEMQIPQTLVQHPRFRQIGQFIRAYFLGQVSEEESSNASQTNLKIKASVSRVGDEAQIQAELAGRKYKIQNIRMPWALRGVFPISMRNPTSYNIMQKLTQNQIPASCRIEPSYVSTFDNKTYQYQLNDCYHLLFKDCSQNIPVAVLAKNVQANSQQKQVKILAGPSEIILTPNLMVKMNFNGHQESINIQAGQTKTWQNAAGQTIVEIKKYQDNVILVNAIQESLWVLYDGERVEVSGSYMLRSRACGLCGDLNGENTADLQTPQQCLMSRPRFAAYSYMVQESCQGIPSQDKAKYQQEKTQCIKKTYIPTPLERLSKIVAAKASQVIN